MSPEEILRAQSPIHGWEREVRAFSPNGGIDQAPRWADFAASLGVGTLVGLLIYLMLDNRNPSYNWVAWVLLALLVGRVGLFVWQSSATPSRRRRASASSASAWPIRRAMTR